MTDVTYVYQCFSWLLTLHSAMLYIWWQHLKFHGKSSREWQLMLPVWSAITSTNLPISQFLQSLHNKCNCHFCCESGLLTSTNCVFNLPCFALAFSLSGFLVFVFQCLGLNLGRMHAGQVLCVPVFSSFPPLYCFFSVFVWLLCGFIILGQKSH